MDSPQNVPEHMDLDEPPDTAALFLSDESDDGIASTPSTAATAFASAKRPLKSEATQMKKVQRASESQKKKTRKNGKSSVSKIKAVFASEKLTPEQIKKLDSALNKLHTRRLRLVHALDQLPVQPQNMSLRELQMACPRDVLDDACFLLKPAIAQHVVKRLCKERRTGVAVLPKRKREPAPKRVRTPRKRSRKMVDPRTREELHSIYKKKLAEVKFPITEKTLTLCSLGTISKKPGYFNSRHIWPIGYKSTRKYSSTVTKDTKVIYTSEIIEGPDGPLFRVTASDNPDCQIVQKSATAAWRMAWMDLVKAGTDKKVTSDGHAPSGPDMYGYSRKSVTVMIEGLPGALDVKDYIFHAHRHSCGRKRETTKKPKLAKRNESSRGRKKVKSEEVATRQFQNALLSKVKKQHVIKLCLEQRGMLRCWQQAQSDAKKRLEDFVHSDTWKTTFKSRTKSASHSDLLSRLRPLSAEFSTHREDFGPRALQVYHMLSNLGSFIGLEMTDVSFREFSTILVKKDPASVNILTKTILELVKAVAKNLCYTLDNEQGKSHTGAPYRTHDEIFILETLQDMSSRVLLTIARRLGGHGGGKILDNLRLGYFQDAKSWSTKVPLMEPNIYCARRKPKGVINRKCHALWRSIWMHPLAGPFKPPIDLNIHVHYVNTVPTPMCLYDVHKKILIGEYSARRNASAIAGARMFRKDMRLIFSNCKTYNATDSKLWKDADHLDKLFERKFQSWLENHSGSGAKPWEDPKIWDNKKQDWCMLCRLDWGNEENQENLVCDGCDGEFHRLCLWPPLTSVPVGDWYCPPCVAERAKAAGTKDPALDPAITHPSCFGKTLKKLSDVVQFPAEFFDPANVSPIFRDYDSLVFCDDSVKNLVPADVKIHQQRYKEVGSIMDLAQRLSSVKLALLEPSEKLEVLDLLCNEVLMTRPMREAMDDRLKQVQSVQHSRQRELRSADTNARVTAAEMMTTMAKKRKRNHVKKLARLAASENTVNNDSYTPRPETPIEDTDCDTPRSLTPIMHLKHTGRMSPEDMMGPPPLMEFKEISPSPLGPQRKRRKNGKANGTSPPRRKRHNSRPAHKPKKPRSAYQFFVKERWQGRLNQIKINQPGNKDRKRMQKETKIFARLWKELPAEERNKFEKLCNDDKARYKQEMFTYIPPLAPDEEMKNSKNTLSIIYFNTLIPRKLLIANSKLRCRHHPVPFEVFVKMPPALSTILANGSASQQAASTWLGGIMEPDEISVRVLSLGKVAGNMAHWCCPMTLLPVGYHVVVTLRTCTLEVKLDCEVIDVDGFPRFKLSTSEGFSPSVTSVKASPDAAWQEALSLLASKMTPQNGEPLSRLFRAQSGDSSSTDEETEALAFLEASAHGTEVPVEVPTTFANTTEAIPTATTNATEVIPTVTVDATGAVPIDTVNATEAVHTATVNATEAVPMVTVNATEAVPTAVPVVTVDATEAVPTVTVNATEEVSTVTLNATEAVSTVTVNATEAVPTVTVNATEAVSTVTVNATEAVPTVTANATEAVRTVTVNATAAVPIVTVNATKVPVDIPPLLPIPEIPKDHTRVWAKSTFGLELFGLQCSTVRRLIEGLPNAERAKDYMFEEEFAVAKQLQPPAQTSFTYNPPHTERHPAWTGFLRMRMTRGEYTGNMQDNLHTPKVDTSQVSPIFMCDFRRAVPQSTNLCNFCNQPAQHSKSHMVMVMNMPKGANFEIKLHQECAHTILDVFYERMSKFHDVTMRLTRDLSYSDITVKFQEQIHAQAVRNGMIGKDRHGNSYWFFGQDLSVLHVLCKPAPSDDNCDDAKNFADAVDQSGKEGTWRMITTMEQYQELIECLLTSASADDRVLIYMLKCYKERVETAMSVALPSKAITAPSPPLSGLSSMRVWQLMKLKVPELDSYLDCAFCAALTRPKEWHCMHCHVTFTRSKAKFLQHQTHCATLAHPASRCTKTMHDIKAAMLAMEALLPWKQLRKQKEFCWIASKRAAWTELVRYADEPRQLWLALSVLEMQIPQAWFADWWPKTAAVSSVSDLPQSFSSSQLFLRLCMLDKALRYSTLFGTDPSADVKEFALNCTTIKHHRS